IAKHELADSGMPAAEAAIAIGRVPLRIRAIDVDLVSGSCGRSSEASEAPEIILVGPSEGASVLARAPGCGGADVLLTSQERVTRAIRNTANGHGAGPAQQHWAVARHFVVAPQEHAIAALRVIGATARGPSRPGATRVIGQASGGNIRRDPRRCGGAPGRT